MLEAHDYTQAQLEEGFALVSPADWRDPICADVAETADLRLIRAAVSHFTGTVARFEHLPKTGKMRVNSLGYRLGPAGDH